MASGVILVGGRQLAFGDGLAGSPDGPATSAQVIVVLTWAAAAGVASWLSAAISRSTLPPLVASAWLFQMAWLSPGVMPREIGMRLLCSIAVALAGFSALVAHRYRAAHRIVQSSNPVHGSLTSS